MATVRFDVLSPHLLAALYARIVWRELGVFVPPSAREMDVYFGSTSGFPVSLFARSVAVAMGRAFARGESVRGEFAGALRQRLERYDPKVELLGAVRSGEIFGHARILAGIVETAEAPVGQEVSIMLHEVADAAAADLHRLREMGEDRVDCSPGGPLGPIWRKEPPVWWPRLPEGPDRWVTPMTRLCEPLWSAQQMAGEDLSYLVDFGLDGIESRPGIIERWTSTAGELVATASKRRTSIKKLVECCRVDP